MYSIRRLKCSSLEEKIHVYDNAEGERLELLRNVRGGAIHIE